VPGTAAAAMKVPPQEPPTQKKPAYPLAAGLRNYLRRYKRERQLPVTYDRLLGFTEGIPLEDAAGKATLWDTVIYASDEMPVLHEALKQVYALLKVDGDFSVMRHLYVDRVDFCTFGNSMPFRIRIVNAYNDNQDYFYIKKADASRVYGLELEHLLSPNRLNFLTCESTLVEEHIPGVPGDQFIESWLSRGDLRPVRVAKELVKFNERCFVRLLGDMRCYNFVFVVTPDFEDAQLRIRAMDFDQQSYDGRKKFYLPQFFRENGPLAQYCLRHLRPETANQYQREEQTLMLHRVELSSERLGLLLYEMRSDTISTADRVESLRNALAEHYQRRDYAQCRTMGELVKENLESIRLRLGKGHVLPEFVPE
jgi:hypothetical protein